MLITRLQVQNYCIVRELDIELRPGINGVLGPNGSGKSSLLDALRFGVTGKSIGDGPKGNNITWGQDQAKVIVNFTHGDSDYVIQRVIGRGGGQRLVTPDGEITANAEINAFMQELLGASIGALLDNVFVPQGSIDSILFSTDTPRQRDIQKSLGLQRAAEAERLLGTEVGRYNVTVGLAEQLEATRTHLEEALTDEEALHESLRQLEAEMEELRPFQRVLHDYQEAQGLTVAIRQANDQLVAAADELEEVGLLLKTAETNREAMEQMVATLKPRAELARRQQVAHEAGKQAQETRESLERKLASARKSLADLPGADADPDTLRQELFDLKSKLSLREKQLSGEVSRPRLDAEKEALRLMDRMVLGGPPMRAFPTEGVQLEQDILHLEEDIRDFSKGVCPRCKHPVEDFDIAAERKRYDKMVAKLDEMAKVADKEHEEKVVQYDQEMKELQKQIDAFEEEAQKALQRSIDKIKPMVDDKAAELEILELNASTRTRLTDQIEQLTSQLDGTPAGLSEEIDLEELQAAIDDYDRAALKLQELTTEVDIRSQSVQKAASGLEEAEEARKELGEAATLPSEAEIKEARSKVEILSARTQSHAETSARLGTAEARRSQYQETVDRLEAQVAKEAQDAAWVKLCKRAREVLHVSGFPRLVMQEYAAQLNRRIHYYLNVWEAPFEFYLDEDLAFVARFPDGRVHSAARLSGGQKIVASTSFRLAMGDTFARNIGLLILDEPSNYLDKDNIIHLQGLLLRLKELAGATGRQAILVTHEECLMGFFDHTASVYN